MSKKCLQIVVFASLSTPFFGGNLMAMDADQQRMCVFRCGQTQNNCVAMCTGGKKEYSACISACDDTADVCVANCKR